MIRDPRARKLSFTGSTEVGRKLVEQSAQQLLRVSMELGGNAPFLVFDDADLDRAVDGALLAKMRNIGEACTAANRFLVHESVAGEFAARLAERMGALRVGRGTEEGVQVGPLITAKAREGWRSWSRRATDARREGAHRRRVAVRAWLVLQADRARRRAARCADPAGGDFRPGRADHNLQLPTTRRSTLANDTEYGLVAYAFTRDLSAARSRVAERLESGMVGLNAGVVSNPAAPFGGVKASGFGREGGREGIEEYLEVKYVGLAL